MQSDQVKKSSRSQNLVTLHFKETANEILADVHDDSDNNLAQGDQIEDEEEKGLQGEPDRRKSSNGEILFIDNNEV